jgi:hypothetical protein
MIQSIHSRTPRSAPTGTALWERADMIVMLAGMPTSGSTFAFNVVRETLGDHAAGTYYAGGYSQADD